jgi:hypothetical protein
VGRAEGSSSRDELEVVTDAGTTVLDGERFERVDGEGESDEEEGEMLVDDKRQHPADDTKGITRR